MALLTAGIVSEVLLVGVKPIWRLRKFLTPFVIFLVGLWLGAVLLQADLITGLIIITLGSFRIVNLIKIGQNKLNEHYLHRIAARSSLTLVGIQIVLVVLLSFELYISVSDFLLNLAVIQLIAAVLLLGFLTRNLSKTGHHMSKHFYSDKELPSVTVAVPARNETHDLASCLRSILASDYPKLEVVVLDDCSQDRTSEVIKDFAHDGVRFVRGREPQGRWLAKNQAYDKLADEASGELVLFCGVDVRFGPEAIKSLVTTLLNKKRSMVSVMPFRVGGGVKTAFIQPMRYWWELVPPRRLFNRPPVLSTCWLIKHKTLKKLGGFDAVSHNVIPEGYFARELVKDDSYAFIRADEHLDIRTVKSVRDQMATAIRTRYPELQKRPENILALVILEFVLLFGPFLVGGLGLWFSYDLPAMLGLTAGFLLILTHYLIMAASNPANVVIALINFPFVVIAELVILVTSMYRYEFSKVDWKGRNICLPVMHVIPKLPKAN